MLGLAAACEPLACSFGGELSMRGCYRSHRLLRWTPRLSCERSRVSGGRPRVATGPSQVSLSITGTAMICNPRNTMMNARSIGSAVRGSKRRIGDTTGSTRRPSP